MDDEIQAEEPKPLDQRITAQIPPEKVGGEPNPFRLPPKRMGPVRKTIMYVGFVGLLALGLSMQVWRKNPFPQAAFLVGSVIFFIWLAGWTTWKRPR
jgi:hypothetical protein